jgi:hypothetical protein
VSLQPAGEAVPTDKMDHAWGQSGLFLALANPVRFGGFARFNSAAWEPKAMRALSLLRVLKRRDGTCWNGRREA